MLISTARKSWIQSLWRSGKDFQEEYFHLRQQHAVNFWLLTNKYSVHHHTVLITKKSNAKKIDFATSSKV